MADIIGTINHYLIPFTVLIGVLIFVHELGHCIVAKLCGIRVLKFSLGFGPKIIGKKIGDTEYLISLIPLGGYVKPLGEAPDEPVPEEDRPFSMTHQGIPKRFAVLAAGSLFNILFAALIFSSVYMAGTPQLTARVGEVVEGSPAERAGIRPGDLVVEVDGVKIELWEELTDVVQQCEGRPLTLALKGSERFRVVSLTPELTEGRDMFGDAIRVYRIGIMNSRSEDAVIIKRYNPAMAVWKGMKETLKWSKLTLVGMGVLARSPVERKDDIGGPILIGKLAGDFAQAGMMSFVLLMAMISVNLGVLNLLPIPILDGGHIFFLFLEALKGSPVSIKKMEVAQQIGLAVLLMIMGFVCYNDVARLFSG